MTLSAEEMTDKVDMTHREHVSNIYHRFIVIKLVCVCVCVCVCVFSDNKLSPLFSSIFIVH